MGQFDNLITDLDQPWYLLPSIQGERSQAGKNGLESWPHKPNLGTILLVEDEPDCVVVLVTFLNQNGYLVEVATTGEEALEKIGSETYDLVLLDYQLPDISGLDVLRTVRNSPNMLSLPVIIVTGRDDRETIMEMYKARANDYLVKPVEHYAALARIQTQLLFRRVQEKLQEQTAVLIAAQRDATVGRLAAAVAHEVNNPLCAMKMHLTGLKRMGNDEPKFIKKVDVLSGQVDRIARIVNSLLGFSRQRSNTGITTPLARVIETVADLFEGSLKSKGVQLKLDFTANLPLICSDVDLIQEVLVNLLENAREVLGMGNTVTIVAMANVQEVEIRVEDDGPGLGDDPEKVFKPYYTTKMHGTGVGLSISRKICEAQGGKILVENRQEEEGGGARFRVILPKKEI